MESALAVAFDGMAEPEGLRLWVSEAMVSVTRGSRLLFRFDEDDVGMRNLAIVSLRDAGVAGIEVAELFGLTPRRVSALRGEVKREGSAAVVRPRGRPCKLTDRDVAKAKRWKSEGVAGSEIAKRLGVSDATISRVTAGVAVAPKMTDIDIDLDLDIDIDLDADAEVEVGEGVDPVVAADGDEGGLPVGAPAGGVVSCRYGGAMLLHAFLSLVDAGSVLGGRRPGPDRFSRWQVSLCAMFGLVLGGGSIESIKHLGRADLGVLAGCGRAPELKTLRARLGAIADGSDALAMMGAFTKAMLSEDPAPDAVFYVDDHFVPYYGARPMAKGWNTKRRHAMPGWDDTMICDGKGRIVAFTSAEPSGLSVTMDAALTQLSSSLGATGKPMLGFDRGGSYPVVFARLDTAGIEWLTYRRGDTIEPGAPPKRSWCAIDGTRHSFLVADEIVALNDKYLNARQITLYDKDGEPAVQILTCNHTLTAARLVTRMRARWGIENAFKALTAHHGIDQLCDYRMDMIDDTREIDNPDRKTINTAIGALRAEHKTITGQIGAIVTDRRHGNDMITERRRLQDERSMIQDEIEALGTHRKTIPAKIPANAATPGKQRAIPKLERRAYQMILRLCTHNALRWLAEQLDTYLNDPDEVHAHIRALLHQPGTITYTPTTITVTITPPDTPVLARALNKLCDQLNHATTPASIPGDHRPITYQTSP